MPPDPPTLFTLKRMQWPYQSKIVGAGPDVSQLTDKGLQRRYDMVTSPQGSLVPRPLPDFISQPWRKIGRRPGTITTSRTGNGGLG